MNLRRGFIGAWIVLSVAYIVAKVFMSSLEEMNPSDWQTFMWDFLMPPLALAAILAAFGWIVSGFRKSRST